MNTIYAIGDIQGCLTQLKHLVKKLPKHSKFVCLGDLVNRGPQSLETLRQLKSWQEQGIAECILGNHDLHLLAYEAGIRGEKSLDTLNPILGAPDRDELIHWLRHRPLALHNGDTLFVHAGVLPQWSAIKAVELAQEVEKVLRKPNYKDFLANMYGNQPDQWHDKIKGHERLRVIVNALTRLRFCTNSGKMDFQTKEGIGSAPPGYAPWFELKNRRSQDTRIVFGHWSTLGLLQQNNVVGLDTGCVWGGTLTAMSLGKKPKFIEVPGLAKHVKF